MLRSGRGADLLMVDVALDIRDLVTAARGRAHPRADRRLRHRQRRPRRGRRDPCRRQGIHPAAARSGTDRRGARRGRRRCPRPDLSRRGDGACGQARAADRGVRCLGADHRRIRHRQGSAGALRARAARNRAKKPFISVNCAAIPEESAGDPNCSATRRAPSPARSRAASASSRRPPAARCCSTKSPKWTCGCRPSCCARSRSA